MFKKYFIPILFLCFISTNAQVGIGTTTPDDTSVLDITSNDGGILIPRMTQAQRDAIGLPGVPATGLLIYQTNNTPGFYYYDGVAWQPFGGSDSDWTISGSNIYSANSGNVGIGTTTPSNKLHVEYIDPSASILDQDFETALTPLTTSGDANWFVQSTSANGGTQAAESGNIADNQESILEYTATVPASGGVLSFFYEVSSELTFDILEFSVDGTIIESWSGIIPWTSYSYNFTGAGTHTITWRYSKDISQDGGDDVARLDDITLRSNSGSAVRIVDGNEGTGKVLTSDVNGNASWSTITSSQLSDVPKMTTVYGMGIPVCSSVTVGSTGTFNVTIKGVATTVNWEVLDRKDVTGQTATIAGQDVLLAPFFPSQLQVRYDFSPDLPFLPDSIFFTGNNEVAPFGNSPELNTFRYDYITKSLNSITLNIGRTDRYGDTTASCWAGTFFFDMLMTQN